MGRDGTIVGMVGPNATPEELRETHAALGGGLEAGALKPVVGRELPLADATRAHVAVMEPGAYGKIVLIP
jgi:NADPH2:quinone reductase